MFGKFRETITKLREQGERVRVHVGCGKRRLGGFLNVDLHAIGRRSDADLFLFDASEPWECDDGCIDYVFSEDFLEHLDQRQQVRFLAETYRVMVPGATQHISTPDLGWVMRERSSFVEGAGGVYDEWGRWSHKLVHTEASLRSMAEMVGFYVAMSCKQSFAVRPLRDRDDTLGNLFVNLTKPPF